MLVALAVTGGCSAQTSATSASTPDAAVSAVHGPSVLKTLGLSVEATNFGKLGGSEAAPPTQRIEPMTAVGQDRRFGHGMFSWFFDRSNRPEAGGRTPAFRLTGADLYRMSCQSCHGPTGAGSPPEILSLTGPVQGTSLALLVQEMKAHDRPVDIPFLRGVVGGAEHDLRQRLTAGGQKMPPFAYLTDQEVDALVGYMQRMVKNPDAPASNPLLTLSTARVGEDVVKGTCHTCHDATGPGRRAMMMQGVIPSLASMPEEEAFNDIVAKVRDGVAPPMMMMMMMMSTGPAKMPKLPFLTPQELAAAMVYLRDYPPQN
jgi:mono/diheme cytochrome c family protein